MMRQLATQGFDRSSARGLVRWAVALLAHNLLLRGGEPGVVDKSGTPKAFDTSRDLSLGSIEFKRPGPESGGLPWMTVDLVSIKDPDARHRTCVLPVRRRGDGGALGDDPMCTYDAVVLAMRQRLGRLPPAIGRVVGPDAVRPLFNRPPRRGQPEAWRTTDTNKLAKDMAAALGLPEDDFGAKSFRISPVRRTSRRRSASRRQSASSNSAADGSRTYNASTSARLRWSTLTPRRRSAPPKAGRWRRCAQVGCSPPPSDEQRGTKTKRSGRDNATRRDAAVRTNERRPRGWGAHAKP